MGFNIFSCIFPRTAYSATPLASHITSNNIDQFKDTIIGVEIYFSFRHSNNFRHASPNINFTFFSNNLHKWLAILEMSLMNLNPRDVLDKSSIETRMPPKLRITFTKIGRRNFSITSIFSLSTSTPFWNLVTKHYLLVNYEVKFLPI